MKFENTKTSGWEDAILGMRLPMCTSLEEAKSKSDSLFYENGEPLKLGDKDLDLMKRLILADNKGNQPNSKYLRMIHVQVCITAPNYWLNEADTYKVGTVRNSSSKMHRLANTPITKECFEMGDYYALDGLDDVWIATIENCEKLRVKYNETKEKRYWKELIRLLPESWLYTSMFDFNYATLRNMYISRKNHKLTEWSVDFIKWVKTLPYAQELIMYG